MEFNLVTKPDLEDIVRDLKVLIQGTTRNTQSGGQAVYANEDLCKMLKVSKRTLQNWRDEGLIEFSQIGHKIYYTQGAVTQMLEKAKVRSFNAYQR